MKHSRSLPLTVSLFPLLLASLIFSFLGVISLIGFVANIFGAGITNQNSMVPIGAGACVIFGCSLAAFKLKSWGIYGLIGMALFLFLMTFFAGVGMLSLAGFVALPVIVSFAMKDFENMD